MCVHPKGCEFMLSCASARRAGAIAKAEASLRSRSASLADKQEYGLLEGELWVGR